MFSKEVLPQFKMSYGARLFDLNGIDQVELIVKKLRKKWWSKSASIGLLMPGDSAPKMPCLISVSTRIRDDALILTGTFRSQNVLRSYGNMFGLRALQNKIANKLKKPLGRLEIFVVCPHVYSSDIEKAQNVLTALNSSIKVESESGEHETRLKNVSRPISMKY